MRIFAIPALAFALQLSAAAAPIVYITDFSDPHKFGTLNLGNGVYSPIGTTTVGEILSGPGGSVYAIDENGSFFKVAANGTDTFIGNSGIAPDEPAGLQDGTIYMDDQLTHKLYTFNTTTGGASLVGPTGFANPVGGLLFLTLIAGQTNVLYGITTSFNTTTGNVIDHSKLYQINRATGAPTFITNVNDDNVDCALIAGGTAYLFDFTAQVNTLNLATGATTPLYDLSGSLGAINGVASVVPEPGTLSLLALAGLALLLARRRAWALGRT